MYETSYGEGADLLGEGIFKHLIEIRYANGAIKYFATNDYPSPEKCKIIARRVVNALEDDPINNLEVYYAENGMIKRI